MALGLICETRRPELEYPLAAWEEHQRLQPISFVGDLASVGPISRRRHSWIKHSLIIRRLTQVDGLKSFAGVHSSIV